MLLSARFLNQVSSVNAFEYASNAQWTEGDTVSLFFQLIDSTVDRQAQGFVPAGRRYMPAAGATLQATLTNIDDSIQIVRSAVQPFVLDPSIWRVDVLSSDKIRGTCDLVLALREGSVSTNARIVGGVLISPTAAL
jgi:hypothetical protein